MTSNSRLIMRSKHNPLTKNVDKTSITVRCDRTLKVRLTQLAAIRGLDLSDIVLVELLRVAEAALPDIIKAEEAGMFDQEAVEAMLKGEK